MFGNGKSKFSIFSQGIPEGNRAPEVITVLKFLAELYGAAHFPRDASCQEAAEMTDRTTLTCYGYGANKMLCESFRLANRVEVHLRPDDESRLTGTIKFYRGKEQLSLNIMLTVLFSSGYFDQIEVKHNFNGSAG